MAEHKGRPSAKMRQLDEEVLSGFTIDQLRCRSCSGYGNCGYRAYYLSPEGKGVISICMMRREQLISEQS